MAFHSKLNVNLQFVHCQIVFNVNTWKISFVEDYVYLYFLSIYIYVTVMHQRGFG